MAPINAGGARRSTAPTYTPFAPVGQTAINTVPQQAAPVAQAPQRAQAAPVQDVSSSLSGFLSGNNRMGSTGNQARQPQLGQSFDPRAAGIASTLGSALGFAGMLAGAAPAVAIGNILGLGGSVAKEDDVDKNLAAFGTMGLSAVGVPSAAISALRAAVTDDVGPLVNAAVNTNPQMGMLNSLAGVLGIGTLGGLVQQEVVAPASATTQEAGDGDGTTTNTVGSGNQGFGVVGRDLGNLSFGSPRGGQGGGYGGYGGGIGQSGGNASGVGSNQA